MFYWVFIKFFYKLNAFKIFISSTKKLYVVESCHGPNFTIVVMFYLGLS